MLSVEARSQHYILIFTIILNQLNIRVRPNEFNVRITQRDHTHTYLLNESTGDTVYPFVIMKKILNEYVNLFDFNQFDKEEFEESFFIKCTLNMEMYYHNCN